MAQSQTSGSRSSWLCIGGVPDNSLANDLTSKVAALIESGTMEGNESTRVADLSKSLASGSFLTSPRRLELLRGLCHLYSAGIRAERISSHRPVIGPLIVAAKKVLLRAVTTLLGPSFQRQREFNAGVIRLLGELCNEEDVTRSNKN